MTISQQQWVTLSGSERRLTCLTFSGRPASSSARQTRGFVEIRFPAGTRHFASLPRGVRIVKRTKEFGYVFGSHGQLNKSVVAGVRRQAQSLFHSLGQSRRIGAVLFSYDHALDRGSPDSNI
jgi:hypothetical protein